MLRAHTDGSKSIARSDGVPQETQPIGFAHSCDHRERSTTTRVYGEGNKFTMRKNWRSFSVDLILAYIIFHVFVIHTFRNYACVHVIVL